MPPRSSWKGFIQLSLVSVPVKAFTATASGSDIRLNQLHEECHNRIQYQKSCPEHGPVPNDEITSGYEYDKGRYVVIRSDEIAKVRRQSDRALRILGFIGAGEIDPIHFSGRTMVLLPDGAIGQKPYALLRRSMEEDGITALARMIIAGREQLVLLRPIEGVIAVSVLTYAERVRSPGRFAEELTDPELTDEELALTRTLIEASRLEEFDLDEFRDPYTEQMTRLIEMKIAGEEIVTVADPEEPKVIHLMEALKQSIANVQRNAAGGSSKPAQKVATKQPKQPKQPAKKRAKKMAPSARTTAQKKKKSG